MKVGLNTIGFAPGQMGGIETYIRALLHHLQLLDQENEYTVLCDETTKGEFDLFNPGFSSKICTYKRKTFRKLYRDILWKGLRIDPLKAEPRYLKLDLIHHPFTSIKQKWFEIPSVLTFHDMQHEFYPDFFSPRELQIRNNAYRPSVSVANQIIAISSFTKQCLVDRYSVDESKITVIHEAYSSDFKVITDKELLEEVKSRYNLERPFLYYPAATWPHKNHKNLLSAFAQLLKTGSFDGDLVLTGIAMQTNNEVLNEISRLGLGSRVKVLGYLRRDELPCLYNLARFMVFPSYFEGFGIPIVEAMACGCPVICSNATSLPEVIGDAGELFNPDLPEEIAELMHLLWRDDGKLNQMRSAGLERARLFDWKHTAEQTLEVYRKVLL